jgi:hypothetical protein
MTDRQLAAAVRYGRRVTCYCPELDDDVIGYVMGFDAKNILVAVPPAEGNEIETVIRNRDYIAGIDIDDKTLMSKERLAEDLERMIVNFRRWVMNEFFPNHVQR